MKGVASDMSKGGLRFEGICAERIGHVHPKSSEHPFCRRFDTSYSTLTPGSFAGASFQIERWTFHPPFGCLCRIRMTL